MAMATYRRPQTRRPNGSERMPARSVRVSDEAWAKAKRRASFEGLTVSNAVAQLVEGYGEGLIDPPKVQKVYPQRKDVAR